MTTKIKWYCAVSDANAPHLVKVNLCCVVDTDWASMVRRKCVQWPIVGDTVGPEAAHWGKWTPGYITAVTHSKS